MLKSLPVLLGTLFLVAAGPAPALLIDFEDFEHDDIVAAPIASHPGYTLIVDGGKHSDAAVVFDTGVTKSRHRDLQFDPSSGWAKGNITDQDLGNILTLQAKNQCDSECRCDFGDKGKNKYGNRGGHGGGTLTFLLDDVATSFAFDLIDAENSKGGKITFFLLEDGSTDTIVDTFSFADFKDLGQDVQYGNNSANHIDLGEIGPFNAFEIVMGRADGIDNIFANGTPVPEPGTAGMIGLGLSALAVARRRRCRG